MAINPGEIVTFWSDVGPEKWFARDPELDATIRRRYLDLWEEARRGMHRRWLSSPAGALAYLILTDQFPRNMFREDARAFATDRLAQSAAMLATQRDWDLRIAEPLRQFFYLPFVHAETLPDQDRGICLILARMPESGVENLLHARAHREVIRRFGRFPWRNAALGRKSTPAEEAFLEKGGYPALVAEMRAQASASA